MQGTRRLAVIGALAGSALLANAQTPTQTPQNPQQHTQHQGQAQAGKEGPSIWVGTDLMGTTIVSPTGEKIGKVEDVLVHPSGEVGYAVVSLEGNPDKLYAMPWTVLRQPTDAMAKPGQRQLILAVEKSRFETAPSFTRSAWPSMVTSDWSKDIDAFYRNDKRADTKQPIPASVRVPLPILRFSELESFAIQSPTGEPIGDIERVAVDASGRVSYVVVKLGSGERVLAVPFGALKVAPTTGDKPEAPKQLLLSVDKTRLEQAPTFEEGKMSDPKWIATVYEYYAVPVYWTPAREKAAEPEKPPRDPNKPKG